MPTDSSKDYYYILRNTGEIEPLIVEYGFIDNDKDLKFLKDNYKDLAESVIKSVLEYKNIPYKEPEKIITDTYKVLSGDTLYSIAKKLDTSIDEIKKLNNLNNNLLSVGQVLKIPTKIVDIGNMDIYQVKSGDTLYQIAKKYSITVDELKEINDLENNDLVVGQLIKVPSGLSLVNTYNVLSGDTLYSIAKKFDTTVQKIKEENNLVDNMLSIGQKLIIPVDEDTIYKVKSGDTLYQIAKNYNTTVDKLKELNNLSNNDLSIDQLLIVRDI